MKRPNLLLKRPSLLLLAMTALAASPAGAVPPGYHLVWSDEFNDGTMPAPDKWRYDTWRNHDGWFNGEAQYYSADRSPKCTR